ncbi:putative DNA-binding protein [Alkalihalophilus lindianensis]|uniref:putative DNA-binding protein n=1 Tax=Alkalihalophilus lindianensis TaxID=1630542 RepID=UPI003F6CFBC8
MLSCKGKSLNKELNGVLDKTLRMNYLFDFYQSLLTPKQRKYMSLYYLDDFSLGEIAEEFEVSRQAVYDNIKRTEAMLEEYEVKLSLLVKFEQRQEILNNLRAGIQSDATPEEIIDHIQSLEKLD